MHKACLFTCNAVQWRHTNETWVHVAVVVQVLRSHLAICRCLSLSPRAGLQRRRQLRQRRPSYNKHRRWGLCGTSLRSCSISPSRQKRSHWRLLLHALLGTPLHAIVYMIVMLTCTCRCTCMYACRHIETSLHSLIVYPCWPWLQRCFNPLPTIRKQPKEAETIYWIVTPSIKTSTLL